MKIVVKRYFFKLKDSDKICYRVISDLEEAHKRIVDSFFSDEAIEKASCEYLSEYDCDKLGIIENIVDKSEV